MDASAVPEIRRQPLTEEGKTTYIQAEEVILEQHNHYVLTNQETAQEPTPRISFKSNESPTDSDNVSLHHEDLDYDISLLDAENQPSTSQHVDRPVVEVGSNQAEQSKTNAPKPSAFRKIFWRQKKRKNDSETLPKAAENNEAIEQNEIPCPDCDFNRKAANEAEEGRLKLLKEINNLKARLELVFGEKKKLEDELKLLKFRQDPNQSETFAKQIRSSIDATMTPQVREKIIQSIPSEFIRIFTFEKIEALVEKMKCTPIKRGFRLFEQGKPCRRIYVVESGRFKLKKAVHSSFANDGSFQEQEAAEWTCHGADEMLYDSVHVRTCTCIEVGKVWSFTRSDFQQIVGKITPKRLRLTFDYLSQVFPSYEEKYRVHLTKNSQVVLCSPGDFVVRKDDLVKDIYVLKKGRIVTVTHGISRGKVLVPGDIISQPLRNSSNKFVHTYLADGTDSAQIITIPITKFTKRQLREITSSDLDATRRRVQANFEAHLRQDVHPDEDQSGSSGYYSQISTSTEGTNL